MPLRRLTFDDVRSGRPSANIAEEVRDVRRVYPRALFGALLVAGVVYPGVAIAASIVLDPTQLAQSTAPLRDVVRATGYGVPPLRFGIIALIAVANGALPTMIMASRMAYGMAEEGLLPLALRRVLPQRRKRWVAIVAIVAIVATTVAAMLLAATGRHLGRAGRDGRAAAAVRLRQHETRGAGAAPRPGGPCSRPHVRTPTVVPVLAIGSCLVLMTQQSAEHWLRAGLLLGAGLVRNYLSGARHRADATAS